MNIEIGGGGGSHQGWRNLDALNGFELTPETVFPADDSSTPIVYSSHCFEHLDDATVSRMLSETRRVLAKDGRFVLKIPHFERVSEAFISGDSYFFDQWGMSKVVKTWPSQGVSDTIAARASMIFCGVWNPTYGDKNAEFTKKINWHDGAYHGPVPGVDEETSKFLVGKFSPRQIARAYVKVAPEGWHFNHRNAWNRSELKYLLNLHGFEVLSTEREDAEALSIPGSSSQAGISMYAICR